MIEFEFVGRFAILKMIFLTGISGFLFLAFLEGIQRRNPWKILVYLPEAEANEIASLEAFGGESSGLHLSPKMVTFSNIA